MTHSRLRFGAWAVASVLAACTGKLTHVGDDDDDDVAAVDAAPGTPDATTATSDLVFCVDETNRYRAMDGKPALSHSQALEDYANEGARVDTQSGSAHSHFSSTGGGGIAFAENECPSFLGWTIQGDVRNTIAECVAAFYSEGPGGGHYENMMGSYGALGCGVYIEGDGITIVQDFGN